MKDDNNIFLIFGFPSIKIKCSHDSAISNSFSIKTLVMPASFQEDVTSEDV